MDPKELTERNLFRTMIFGYDTGLITQVDPFESEVLKVFNYNNKTKECTIKKRPVDFLLRVKEELNNT